MTVGMSQQLQLNVMHASLQQTRQCELTAAGKSNSIQQPLKNPCYIQIGLLDRLGRIVPKGLDCHIFANSGSEVVENAIKMARAHTKRTNIICFDVSTSDRFLARITILLFCVAICYAPASNLSRACQHQVPSLCSQVPYEMFGTGLPHGIYRPLS